MMQSWVVLRCANAQTLKLADSLNSAGIEAWSPREPVQKVVRGKSGWIPQAMIPSFVFASADHLSELLELERSPSQTYLTWDAELRRMVSRGHPYFRLFRSGDQCRPIPDFALAPLRVIEGRRGRKPRGKPKVFHCGDRVRLTEGAYAGLRGVVVIMKGKMVRVSFPGSLMDFDVPGYVLIPELDEATQHSLHESQYRRAA